MVILMVAAAILILTAVAGVFIGGVLSRYVNDQFISYFASMLILVVGAYTLGQV